MNTAPHNLRIVENGSERYGHLFNECEWSSEIPHSGHTGEVVMWRENIRSATGSFLHNTRCMKLCSSGGTLKLANLSHTSCDYLSLMRQDCARARRTALNDELVMGGGPNFAPSPSPTCDLSTRSMISLYTSLDMTLGGRDEVRANLPPICHKMPQCMYAPAHQPEVAKRPLSHFP